MPAMKIFVSHNRGDNVFCAALVRALRAAGADVWYDEHNLGAGQLMDVIQKELEQRPIFLGILSKAAFASKWVQREVKAAFELADRDPDRLLLFVTAEAIERTDFNGQNGWLFFADFKRIEDAGMRPLDQAEAIRRTLHTLALTPPGERPAAIVPQSTEATADLITRGKALSAQYRYREALPFFEKATIQAPASAEAWFLCADALNSLGRSSEALIVCERALSLDPNFASAWTEKGVALRKLKQYPEALEAHDHALALAPDYAYAWMNKGYALHSLGRDDEAITAIERAITINPNDAYSWRNKGDIYFDLGRYQEALAAHEHAIALDPQYTYSWNGKGNALARLHRYQEALEAAEHAIKLDPQDESAWNAKGNAYLGLGRYKEAIVAYEQAIALNPNDAVIQQNRQGALDALKKQG